MALPSSGPISFGDINVEAGRTRNTANTRLAGDSTPVIGSLFYIYENSGVTQIAPHAISEFYGISYTSDPPTSTLTVSYSGGIFYATLSNAINSTTITLSSLNVSGYTNSNCGNLSGETDTESDNLTVTAGLNSGEVNGTTALTSNSTYYNFSATIVVNGTSRANGSSFTIGGTTVTISYPSAGTSGCSLYEA